MELPVRGVESIERAGAIVADSDDADSLFNNPAGLAHLTDGNALLIDAAQVEQKVQYRRIDSGGNLLPSIHNTYPGIVTPTVALSHPLSDKLVIAAGLDAPYAGIQRYDPAGPERYTSASLAQSLFVQLSLGVGYKVSDQLRVGVTVNDTISMINSRVTLSGCPGETVCAPEDPEWDADTQLKQTDLFAPSASAGIQFDAIKQFVTLGAFAQTPTWLNHGTGTIETRLPSSSFFQNSSVQGNSAKLDLTLPAMFKGGILITPDEHLRIEIDLDVELWSEQKRVTITPDNVSIVNANGVGTYQVGETEINRNYNNSYSPSIGGEYREHNWRVGAGFAYESAASPADNVSTLTFDSTKRIYGVGGGITWHKWDIGAAFGYVHLHSLFVPLDEAGVDQLSPIRGQPNLIPVNAGTYHSHYWLGGLRFARRW